MPGNEVEDRIRNFFEQDNSSQGHLQAQTVGGSWPVNYSQWGGNQRQIGEAISFNLKNFNVQKLDSVVGPGSESLQVSFDQNHSQGTLRPQLSESYSRNQQFSSNGLIFGHQNLQTRQNQTQFLGEDTCDQHNPMLKGLSNFQLQQKSASEDSPTLTTNSERSETAETPDFNFLGGQQHFIRSQHQGMPQPQPRQASGFSDMQLVQQHIMFKQLQDLQRQQQLQRLGDTKQNNSINQLSALAKQASGGQFPPLINGTPIHEASQMFMNLVQRGAPPSVQGLPNRLPNAQEQGQTLRSMGLVPQQLDASLYGTPVASARGNMNPYTHLRGMSHDSNSFLANISANQSQKPPMQPSAFSNPFIGIAPQEQGCMPDGTFIAKQGFQERNLFGQIPIQDLNSGVVSENFHQGNGLQRNAPVQESNVKLERTGWHGDSQEKATQMDPSPGLSALDPMEEKILFNMDDNWDASLDKRPDMGTGSFGNTWEHTDYTNIFPSVNSGSWSALMQSAVAEASSSDTGLQEEWSGLTFQNTELSTDNQPSHFLDSAKQETGWVDNNLQSASSLSSKPFPAFNDSNMSSSFPGFQQSGMQFSTESRERIRPDSSHESIQQSPRNSGRWLDYNSQQKPEGSQQMQSLAHLENAWGGQIFEQSVSNAHRENASSYNSGSQPCNKPKGGNFQSLSPGGNATLNIGDNENNVGSCWAGDITGAIYKERNPDGCLWKADGNRGVSSFSNSTGGLEQIPSGADDTLGNGDDSQINKFCAVPNSISRVVQETNQQVSDGHHLDYMKHVNISVKHKESENISKHQHQLNNSLQVLDSSYKGAGKVYDQRQNCFQRENSSDSYNSNASQHTITGREGRDNVWLNASDPRNLAGSDPKSSGQVGWKASSSHRLLYHPMGNSGVSAEPADTLKHATNPQLPCQQVSEGLSSREQGYLGHFQIVGNVSNSNLYVEKGNLPDFQGNLTAPEELPSGVSLRPNAFASSDRSAGFYSPNVTVPTSQNMLELLNKVDQTREDSSATRFGTPDCNPLSRVPEPEASDVSIVRPYNSASQGFGLRLAPPLQRLPNSNHFFPSQGSSQAASNLKVRHVNIELAQKGQTWIAAPSSMQSLPPHESSQTGCWDDKSSISGHAGIGNSHSNLQANSPAAFTAGSPYLRSQLQKQFIPNAPVVRQTLQASSPSTAGRVLPFNLAPSEDTSRQIYANSFGQPFPVLEAVPVTQPSILSGMSQLSGFSARPNNVWTNIPTQRHLSGSELHNVPSSSLPSTDLSKRNLETTPSVAPQELNDQNSQKGGNESLEFGACSMNSQGFDYGEEKPGKERSQQQMLSEILSPPTQTNGFPQEPESVVKHISGARAVASESVRFNENQFQATSERDFEAFGRSLKPSPAFHQNYPFMHQAKTMRNLETDLGKVNYPLDNELNAESQPKPFPTGEKKIVSFSSAAREDQNVKASSEPLFQGSPSQEMVTFGQQDSQGHSTGTNLAPNAQANSQINLQMAPSWFKQFQTLRNGQMFSMFDTRIAKIAMEQLSVGKSENLLVCASVRGGNAADASQVSSVWPSTAATLVGSGLTPPYVLPHDSIDENFAVMSTKKRKIASSELLPWHKEVTQDSQRLQNIRMVEIEWAQTTNQLIEKMDYEAEMIEDRLPMIRPKRRLILTTQLMQQLLRPAPRAILSTDATSAYDCVMYYIAKLALGDACSLSSCARSDSRISMDNCNMMHEKLKSSERIGRHYFSKVVEGFSERAKNLENDLLRLDKAASILDVKVECQELEKFSVINRFARFHSRGQAGAAENSSASGAAGNVVKTIPQRYVTALPLPSKLPEGVQCLSL